MTDPVAIADEKTDRRIMVTVVVVLGIVIAVFTSVQSVIVLGVFSPALSGAEPVPVRELTVRIGVNVVGALAVALGVAVMRPERSRAAVALAKIIGIALWASALRAALQALVGIYRLEYQGLWPLLLELLTAAALLVLAQGVALMFVVLWRRARSGERMRLAAQERSLQLLRQLQDEELRVRREIAETIHGSVQGVFVVLEARLRHLAQPAGDPVEGSPPIGDELRDIADQLGQLRERELRQLSARLYPVDLARGTGAAVRTLLARLPAWVSVTDDASELLEARAASLSLEAQVVIVRVVEEALSNALRHADARTIVVRGWVAGDALHVQIDNDGTPPVADAAPSGLSRLSRRAEVLGGSLRLHAQQTGAALQLELPVR